MTTEWRLISTAPDDGSSFLGFEYDSDGKPCFYSCYCSDGGKRWFIAASMGDVDYYVKPTHWKPHDDPP